MRSAHRYNNRVESSKLLQRKLERELSFFITHCFPKTSFPLCLAELNLMKPDTESHEKRSLDNLQVE